MVGGGERQLAFEDLNIAISEAEEQKRQQTPDTDKPKCKRMARRNRGNQPENLPRIEQVIEPDSLACPCGCGQMHKIGEDRTERLDIVPTQLRVIVTVRPKYACRACTDGVTQGEPLMRHRFKHNGERAGGPDLGWFTHVRHHRPCAGQ